MKHVEFRKNRPASALTAVLVTAGASFIAYQIDIPDPVLILTAVMIFFTAVVNSLAGLASGICIVLYALYFFSDGHSFIHFHQIGPSKCVIVLLSLLIIYLLVAWIRKRTEHAYEQLEELNQHLEQENSLLQNESDHDALTGITNRRGGGRRVRALMAGGAEISEAAPGILASMDIDDFKDINDIYGHDAGDAALQHLVRCLQDCFRENSVLTRFGGDEFEVFLYGKSFEEQEAKILSFCRQVFCFTHRGKEIGFHISCGYAVFPAQAKDLEALYRHADTALYAVKLNGKHQAAIYREDMDQGQYGLQNFNMQKLSENLPVAFLIYRADGKGQILEVSSTLLQLSGCRNFQEFQNYTGGTFRGFVHPDDRERVEASIREQIAASCYGLDTVSYRIRTKNGAERNIQDIGRLVHDPKMGDLFYVVVYDRERIDVSSVEKMVRDDREGHNGKKERGESAGR